jgi:hypothetical protein
MPDVEFPIFAVAKIAEPIQPIERGDVYEDPLAEFLESKGLGAVVGGGTLMETSGEIAHADIELELANAGEAAKLAVEFLEKAGAPRGSELRIFKEGEGTEESVTPFGTREGFAVYLDGATLPDEVYQQCGLDDLNERLTAALSADGAGEVRGFWSGAEEVAVYVYGADAKKAYAAVEPVLRAYALCQNSRVVFRNLPAGVELKTIEFPRWN